MGDNPEKTRNGQRGISRHPQELVPSGKTYIHADSVQMGLGGTTSWGAMPLEKYLVHPVDREFNFVLRPVVNL